MTNEHNKRISRCTMQIEADYEHMAAAALKASRDRIHKETILSESGLTWRQRKLFHRLVDDGMQEWNAYTACLSVE